MIRRLIKYGTGPQQRGWLLGFGVVWIRFPESVCNYTQAIVEKIDGRIHMVDLGDIKFLDTGKDIGKE